MATASEILALAKKEIGVKESPAGSNDVKYNTEYYGRRVSGGDWAWCAVFVWWLFQQADASNLYYDGDKTAYVPTLVTWAKKKGLVVDTPKPGDLVCFDFKNNNRAGHVGVCESWDGQYVTTIDGNTGTGNEANGGCVMRRRRHKKYIFAIIRPKYDMERVEAQEDDDMDISKLTDEDISALADRIDRLRGKQKPSNWSSKARKWAEDNGIVIGDGTGNSNYKKACSREELVQILYNFTAALKNII